MKIIFTELYKHKLRDGGFEVSRRYPQKSIEDNDADFDFFKRSIKKVVEYNEKLYVVICTGNVIKDGKIIGTSVELLPLKVTNMVELFLKGDTWHP